MSSWMTAEWQPATSARLEEAMVGTGVYELRDPTGEVVDIGFAGGREIFGLRSALGRALAGNLDAGWSFRCEPHVQYMSRYVELVLDFKFRHGGNLPARAQLRGIEISGRIDPGTSSQS